MGQIKNDNVFAMRKTIYYFSFFFFLRANYLLPGGGAWRTELLNT